jgi:non-specific serine/threonine protein kinase
MDTPPTFAELLRRYRAAAALTQEELAERAGMSARGIADLERGARTAPYARTVRQLAEVLGVDADERALLIAARGRGHDARREPLSASMTSFVGRQRELHDVHRLLRTTRLLTLAGPGGVGKTRLAREALSSATEDLTEITFVDLSAIAEPQLLPGMIALSAGVRDQPEELTIQSLIGRFRLRDCLLILDNCEHLVGACAELATTLIGECPRLRILATSREPLDIYGETVLRVPPLQQRDAVALFAERARAVRPDFNDSPDNAELVARICNRLDGLPLAIELAAARVGGFSLHDILSRLDARFALPGHGRRMAPPRHRTLRATLDWSYELLSEKERLLLLRLSVFAGGCTLEAIENVAAGGDIQAKCSLGLLSALVAKSLVQAEHQASGTVRYRLLESVRQYASELLPASEDPAAVRHRHASFYATLEQHTVRSHLLQSDPDYDEVEPEHDNIRHALRWLIDCREVETVVQFAAALGPFWFFNGRFSEGRAWLNEVLAFPHRADMDNRVLLMRAGQLAWCQGDFKTARAQLEESVRLFERAGDQAQLAQALAVLGHLSRSEGDYAGAIALYERVLATCQSAPNIRAQANALLGLSQTAHERGDSSSTRAWANQTLEFARDHAMKSIAIAALQVLGVLAEREGNLSTAHDQLSESVASARSLGSRGQWWVVMGLPDLARVVGAQGDVARALRLLAEAAELARQLGDLQGVARVLESCAWVAAETALYERALRLGGAAATLRGRTGAPSRASDTKLVTQVLDRCRAALGPQQTAACWSAGQSLTIDIALNEAASPPPSLSVAARSSAAPGGLTPREREVVALVARGLSNRQIAEALVITESTAIRHISNILVKLGMASRAQIAVWAVSHRLGDPVAT